MAGPMPTDNANDNARPTLKGRFPMFDVPRPASAEQWEKQRPELRKTLWRLLGDLPPRFTPKVSVDRREARDGFTVEHFTFDNGVGDLVHGYTLLPADGPLPTGCEGDSPIFAGDAAKVGTVPADGPRRRPAILYHHYHGDRYAQGKEELFIKAFNRMGDNPMITGVELVRAGYVVLAIDAYGFGERRYQGPAGRAEDGKTTEASLFKTFLWQGRTLWGMIVRDDLLALSYLASRPEVDPERIAAMGMSMGSTRTWWAAALDDRIRVSINVACLTRYQELTALGNLRYHGIYYYVPGVLGAGIDAEAIVGLIAPRPLLTMTGDQDAGSPVDGVRKINAFQEHLYRIYGKDCFRGIIYPGAGHVYTPEMWQETLGWLRKHLC